jgi:hypothetical protein
MMTFSRAGNREAKIWLHDLTVAINTGYAAHRRLE